MKKSEFLARNHWSLTSTYQLKTGFDFCLRIKASTFIISYDLPPPFFSIDVFRDKVLSLGFSRSVSLVQCVWLPANLKGVGLSFSWSLRAISQGRSGGRAGKGRRACNYVSGIWIPPVAPRRLSCQITASQSVRSGNERECKQTRAKGNDLITNVISANQHFALTFSMQIFKFQRWVANSPSFSRPEARVPRRPCSQATFHAIKQTIIKTVKFRLPVVIKSLISRIKEKQNKKRQEEDLRRRGRESAKYVLLSRNYL